MNECRYYTELYSLNNRIYIMKINLPYTIKMYLLQPSQVMLAKVGKVSVREVPQRRDPRGCCFARSWQSDSHVLLLLRQTFLPRPRQPANPPRHPTVRSLIVLL